MYSLYIRKKEKALDITEIKGSGVLSKQEFKKEVTQFDSSIYLCLDKEPLVEMATEIKEEWISEAEAELDKLRKIDLDKPKYRIT